MTHHDNCLFGICCPAFPRVGINKNCQSNMDGLLPLTVGFKCRRCRMGGEAVRHPEGRGLLVARMLADTEAESE